MEFEKVIDGILRYIDREILKNMNPWQEVLARLAIGRIVGDTNGLKEKLMTNGYIKTFAIMDRNGNIDIDSITGDLKKEIARVGKIEFSIPAFGKLAFTADDVDVLLKTIKEA